MSDPVAAPGDTYVRARWVPAHTVAWVEHADAIMREFGSVEGRVAYEHKHQARWRARRLIDLMVQLRIHPRWHLKEHCSETPQGWVWSVEYLDIRRTK